MPDVIPLLLAVVCNEEADLDLRINLMTSLRELDRDRLENLTLAPEVLLKKYYF